MLTANLQVGQISGTEDDTGETLLMNSVHNSFLRSPGQCLFSDDAVKSMYLDPSTTSQGPIVESDSDLYPLHSAFPSMPNFDSSADMLSTSTSQPDSKTPASTLSSGSQSKALGQPPEKQQQPKRRAGKQKQLAESEKTTGPTKTRRQPKRESRRTTRVEEPKKPTRRERSLERNRVAASKCRKRKKAWTEKLEEKKSGLEAMHNELQSQYLSLLQESSHLKNHLITHAGCHDPNIDVWISNEASKYVRRLSGENSQRPRSVQSLLSLENHSAWQSSANSQYTGISESSPTLNEDDSNGEEEDVEEGRFDDDDFGDDMF